MGYGNERSDVGELAKWSVANELGDGKQAGDT
jgi:hypothetical protein